jgi:hypothetical protein
LACLFRNQGITFSQEQYYTLEKKSGSALSYDIYFLVMRAEERRWFLYTKNTQSSPKVKDENEGVSHAPQSVIKKNEVIKSERMQVAFAVPNSDQGMPSTSSSMQTKTTKHKIRVPAKPEMTKVNEAVDLINFSDSEILDTGNLGAFFHFYSF